MVNFIYQFNWAKGCPGSLISSVIMRMFLEEISVWFSRLIKRHILTTVNEHHPVHWGQIEQNGKGKVNSLSLLKVGHPSVSAVRQCSSWFLGFWLQTDHYSTGSTVSPAFQAELYHWLSCFSSLQMDNYDSPWPPKLHEPILIIQTSSYTIHNKNISYEEPRLIQGTLPHFTSY